ncbi:hypothetical protein D3C75_718670 [compost metagenome]
MFIQLHRSGSRRKNGTPKKKCIFCPFQLQCSRNRDVEYALYQHDRYEAREHGGLFYSDAAIFAVYTDRGVLCAPDAVQ